MTRWAAFLLITYIALGLRRTPIHKTAILAAGVTTLVVAYAIVHSPASP